MKDFDFLEQRKTADTDLARSLILKHLRQRFPEVLSIQRAALENDKQGADFILEFRHCQFRLVDAKVRSKDYARLGQPDICLEIWSNEQRKVPGWAIDDSKLTDYVLFAWTDTERAALFDYRMLRAVVKAHISAWQRSYRTAQQRTTHASGSFTSSVIFVPGASLAEAIADWQAGSMLAA